MAAPEISRALTAKHFSKGNRKVVGIILHDTAGSGTHNDTLYLANPGDGRKVSVDFTVERNGDIYQLNPDLRENWTYHAGRSTKFKGLRSQQVTKGCIGIEIVQKANLSLVPLYTPEQVAAVAQLCVWLVEEFELSREDITTHEKVITDRSRTDPRKFPWAEFWSEYDTASGKPAPETSPDSSAFHVVEGGDTLWSLAFKYATSIENIKQLNDLNDASNLITVGQRLRVR